MAGSSQAVSGYTGTRTCYTNHLETWINSILQDLLARHTEQSERTVLQPSRLYLRFLDDNNSVHLPGIVHKLHLLLQYRVSLTEKRILTLMMRIKNCDF